MKKSNKKIALIWVHHFTYFKISMNDSLRRIKLKRLNSQKMFQAPSYCLFHWLSSHCWLSKSPSRSSVLSMYPRCLSVLGCTSTTPCRKVGGIYRKCLHLPSTSQLNQKLLQLFKKIKSLKYLFKAIILK